MINKKEEQMIRQSAEIICKELLGNMKTPVIIFSRIPEMQTETTKAMAVLSEVEEPRIYIDPNIEVDPTLVMVIGHELRHVYQQIGVLHLGLLREAVGRLLSVGRNLYQQEKR